MTFTVIAVIHTMANFNKKTKEKIEAFFAKQQPKKVTNLTEEVWRLHSIKSSKR